MEACYLHVGAIFQRSQRSINRKDRAGEAFHKTFKIKAPRSERGDCLLAVAQVNDAGNAEIESFMKCLFFEDVVGGIHGNIIQAHLIV